MGANLPLQLVNSYFSEQTVTTQVAVGGPPGILLGGAAGPFDRSGVSAVPVEDGNVLDIEFLASFSCSATNTTVFGLYINGSLVRGCAADMPTANEWACVALKYRTAPVSPGANVTVQVYWYRLTAGTSSIRPAAAPLDRESASLTIREMRL